MVASTLLGNQTVRVLPPSPANKRHPTAPPPYTPPQGCPRNSARRSIQREVRCVELGHLLVGNGAWHGMGALLR